jgi:L-malate glycosyltransferase
MKKRVLICGSGKSFHATRWANSLQNRGLDVIFVTIHHIERPIDPSVTVIKLASCGKLSYLTSYFSLKNIIQKSKPDIVHAHFATGYGFMLALQKHMHKIISVYGTDIFDFPQKSLFHKFLLQCVLGTYDKILSTSEIMADKFLEVYPRKQRPIVTPFGVDISKFKLDEVRSNLGCFKVGIVKKLEHKYGLDILIQGFFKFIHGNNISASLSIVGDGSKRRMLEELVCRQNLEDKVTFLGPLDNEQVPHFLNTLDVFVVPSRSESESFGVAAVEASSCGLPVIATNIGGLAEVIEHNQTGILVEVESSDAIANALTNLYFDDGLRRRMSENAIRTVKLKYDWENNVRLMMDIYDDNF